MKTLNYTIVLTFSLFLVLTSCEKEEPTDNVNDSAAKFDLCVTFNDASLDSFDPFNDNSEIRDYLNEVPYYTSDNLDGQGDIYELTFTYVILAEEAQSSSGYSELIYHLFYEGRGQTEIVTLDCVGNNVTEAFLEEADEAILAADEYINSDVEYQKYHYYVNE